MSKTHNTPYTLELTAETYEELSSGLAGIRAVTNAIKAIIPPYQAERLEACLAKSMGAIGMMEVARRDMLDHSPTLAEVNARRGFPTLPEEEEHDEEKRMARAEAYGVDR